MFCFKTYESKFYNQSLYILFLARQWYIAFLCIILIAVRGPPSIQTLFGSFPNIDMNGWSQYISDRLRSHWPIYMYFKNLFLIHKKFCFFTSRNQNRSFIDLQKTQEAKTHETSKSMYNPEGFFVFAFLKGLSIRLRSYGFHFWWQLSAAWWRIILNSIQRFQDSRYANLDDLITCYL